MEKQAAFVKYFFKDVYSDLADLVTDTYAICIDRIDMIKENISDSFGEFKKVYPAFLVGFHIMRLILACTLQPLVSLMYVASLYIVSALISAITFFAMSLVWIADQTFLTFKQVSSNCHVCQQKFRLPVYVCPNCGAKHTRLVPSVYGIFTRTCNCGEKLPTTFFNGRQKLTALCPFCLKNGTETVVKDGGYHFDISIPVIGAPSAGKTCFINMAISDLEQNAESKYGLKFEDGNLSDYAEERSMLSAGKRANKTAVMDLQYYRFYLNPVNSDLRHIVSLCDIGGEAFSESDRIGRQIGYRYANAIIVLIDPFAIRKFTKSLPAEIKPEEYGASKNTIDEVLIAISNLLTNMYGLKSSALLATDVAVVFTKSDLPGIDEAIGDKAVDSYMTAHPEAKNRFDVKNALCEEFLLKYEEDNFVNTLKSKFKSYQFFTCSALGHIEDGTPFVQKDVDLPVLWLVDKATDYINLKEIWGKTI